MKRTIKCDKCCKDFIQKWVNASRNWSKINFVNYWTDGKNWNNYQLICRPCLNNWFENDKEVFSKLVTNSKKIRIFNAYRGAGTFTKLD